MIYEIIVHLIYVFTIGYLIYDNNNLKKTIEVHNKAYQEMILWMVQQENINKLMGITIMEIEKFIKNISKNN